MKDPQLLIRQTGAVLAALPPPGHRLDRRRLADQVTRFPHALDSGPLPGLVIAVLAAAGTISPGLRSRAAWDAVGVDCDDLTGGLITIGVHPAGWVLPAGASVTLPPRELARCAWNPPPRQGAWVFVTENPSVATAAADLADTLPAGHEPVRLLCTSGTPSAREISAIARLADAGWNVAVRADFDEAGLNHVTALLTGIPGAVAWRMGAAEYLASLAAAPPGAEVTLGGGPLPTTPWDPRLHAAMADRRLAAYEETLVDDLLHDLRHPLEHPPSGETTPMAAPEA